VWAPEAREREDVVEGQRKDSGFEWRSVIAVLCVTLVTIVAVATGCGSSGQLPAIAAPSTGPTTIQVRVVTDRTWRFRMAYPDGWVGTRYENPEQHAPAGSLLFLAAFADPHGAKGNGSYLDSVQLAIYQLETPLQPSDLTPQLASQIAVKMILRGMTSFSARELRKVKVGGVPGWTVGYQFKAGSQTVDANSILIVRGDRAYWLTTQSGAYSWQRIATTLATCQGGFRLLPASGR